MKDVLARINFQLAVFRRALAHDHRDEEFWGAFGATASQLQYKRARLRESATLLHVERATRRGRIHATGFATLDEQRTWLADRQGVLDGLRASEYTLVGAS